MYVFDATPLIYLAAAERLPLVDELPAPCVITERVYGEVVTSGIEQGHADARRVERAVDAGVLDVRPVAATDTFDRVRRNGKLSEADAVVLALADEHGATAVMDEQYGRDVADAEAITTRGTAYLLLRLLAEDVIDGDEVRETIDTMLDDGWYCSPDLYAKLTRKIDEMTRERNGVEAP